MFSIYSVTEKNDKPKTFLEQSSSVLVEAFFTDRFSIDKQQYALDQHNYCFRTSKAVCTPGLLDLKVMAVKFSGRRRLLM